MARVQDSAESEGAAVRRGSRRSFQPSSNNPCPRTDALFPIVLLHHSNTPSSTICLHQSSCSFLKDPGSVGCEDDADVVVVGVGAHFKRGVAAQEELLLHIVKASLQTAHVGGICMYAMSTGQDVAHCMIAILLQSARRKSAEAFSWSCPHGSGFKIQG